MMANRHEDTSDSYTPLDHPQCLSDFYSTHDLRRVLSEVCEGLLRRRATCLVDLLGKLPILLRPRLRQGVTRKRRTVKLCNVCIEVRDPVCRNLNFYSH